MKKLPKLFRRKRDGREFGAWHVLIRNKPINLSTDDRELAVQRRKEAIRGVRQWPRKFAPKVQAHETSRNPPEGAVADALAALGEVANDGRPEHSPAGSTGDGGASGDHGAPLAPDAPPVVDAEPIPPPPSADGWAADVGAASAAPTSSDGAPEPQPRLRLTDFAWFDAALVTASKACVGLQLKGQAAVMRLVGDVEAGRVGPPVKLVDGDGIEAMAAFMKIAGARWEADDPRERGRAAYERTIVALIPAELPVPAWLKWLEAPVITALDTAPVQWQGGRKIERDANGNEIKHDDAEAPPVAQAA